MKRIKRRTIRRIALGLAVAAVVPATAQARPMDVSGTDLRAAHAEALASSSYLNQGNGIQASDMAASGRSVNSTPVEIPYLSHGVGFSASDVAASGRSVNSTPVEIPYLSHGVGFSAADTGASESTLGPGEIPSIVPATRTEPIVEIPYMSHGVGFDASDVAASGTRVDSNPAKADDGIGWDVGTGTVSGLVLLLAGLGAGIAIRQSRKTKLSPA